LQDVVFRVPGRAAPILDGVSLVVWPGERVAIVGPVGSGKSTLLKLVVKLNVPDSGEIYLDGRSYRELSASQVMRRVAYVPQTPALFNRSIYQNITYGVRPAPDPAAVAALLDRLELSDVFAGLEGGLEARVGKGGAKLSGGQRQVVACMRVLLQDPEIVALDEVTASLDAEMKRRLMRLFDVMFAGKTVLLVTHDPALLAFAERTINLI
jgi:ABC-type bacteriocin/lantibiotic exporter with double-glycine peptidase domain